MKIKKIASLINTYMIRNLLKSRIILNLHLRAFIKNVVLKIKHKYLHWGIGSKEVNL